MIVIAMRSDKNGDFMCTRGFNKLIASGTPLLVTLLWTLLVYCQNQSRMVTTGSNHASESGVNQINTSMLGCPFMPDSSGDDSYLELMAYTVPVCAILVCNTIFLIWIMGVRKRGMKRSALID